MLCDAVLKLHTFPSQDGLCTTTFQAEKFRMGNAAHSSSRFWPGGFHRLRRKAKGLLCSLLQLGGGSQVGTVGPGEETNFPMGGCSPCLGDSSGPPAPSSPPLTEPGRELAGHQALGPPSVALGSSLNTALPKWGGAEPLEGAGLHCSAF